MFCKTGSFLNPVDKINLFHLTIYAQYCVLQTRELTKGLGVRQFVPVYQCASLGWGRRPAMLLNELEPLENELVDTDKRDYTTS